VAIRDNVACDGGGVYSEDSSPELTNVVISGNYAYFDAGGIWIDDSATVLTNVIVSGNRASSGGGLYVYFASPTLTNVTLIGNEVDDWGGGLVLMSGSPSMTNVSISGNIAGLTGGGVHATSSSPAMVYCNGWGNSPDDYSGMTDPTGADGNRSVDPGVLDVSDPEPIEWDLHLSTTSPLIDAGDPAIGDPDGSLSDMGAYGGPGAGTFDLDWDSYFEWWLPGPYDSDTSTGMDCDDLDGSVYPGVGC